MNNKRNRYECFEFNGKHYGVGTVVKFKHDYVKSLHKDNDFYGRYYYGRSYNDSHTFELSSSKAKFDGREVILADNKKIYDIVEKIIVPVEVPYVAYTERKYAVKDWEDEDLIIWWAIYLFVMFVSLIFVWPIRFTLWAAASFIFWGCRHEKLKEYGYK